MNLRRVEVNDVVKLLTCNVCSIPENYYMKYWIYIILRWPELSFLAEDESGKVVGYVLSSIEPEEGKPSHKRRQTFTQIGHINSLSVLRPYRRLGIAQRLMNLSRDAMLREPNVPIKYIQLHVRKSNRAARSLYDKLGYKHHHVEERYYADGEDGVVMRLSVQSRNPEQLQRLSGNTRRRPRKTWIANIWHFLHDRPHRFAEATMSLLRRGNSHP